MRVVRHSTMVSPAPSSSSGGSATVHVGASATATRGTTTTSWAASVGRTRRSSRISAGAASEANPCTAVAQPYSMTPARHDPIARLSRVTPSTPITAFRAITEATARRTTGTASTSRSPCRNCTRWSSGRCSPTRRGSTTRAAAMSSTLAAPEAKPPKPTSSPPRAGPITNALISQVTRVSVARSGSSAT